MSTYRIWPATSGPATATANSGSFISGTSFCVTGEGWFQGYWWWVAPAGGQSTAATKCALWQIDSGGTPHLVPGSVVTSGTLTAGQWNFIPISTPLLLSWGGSTGTAHQSAVTGVAGPAQYVAAITCNSGPFPDTNAYWGAGQFAPSGIQNGPLLAYSAQAASMPAPLGSMPQGSFTVAGTDPSVNCPQTQSATDNFWVDVQVADYATAWPTGGTSLRLWPNFPIIGPGVNNDTTVAVSGTAFTLSRACTLNRIWFYSPSGALGLPSRVGIWNTSGQTEVPGTDNSSPSWSGAAASGWVSVSYGSVTLAAGTYMVAFFNGNGQKIYTDTPNYFFSGTDPVGGAAVGGPGWNGLSFGGGILTAPNVANGPLLVYDDASGTKPGQTAYQPGPTAWAYPGEFEASADWAETRWADVEVTPLPLPPVAPASGGVTVSDRGRLAKKTWLVSG